jgi:hypothetical protein
VAFEEGHTAVGTARVVGVTVVGGWAGSTFSKIRDRHFERILDSMGVTVSKCFIRKVG